MDQTWLIVGIAIAIVLLAVVFLTRKKKRTNKDNALVTLGIALVVLGIVFGDDRLLGYSFIGVGVLLSIISATTKIRKHEMNFMTGAPRYPCAKDLHELWFNLRG